jgi:DNA-binding PadR family transcriptional regulator
MADEPLGEFELLVLLAVLRLTERDDPAFGSAVLEELRGGAGRTVARGAVYVTLDRLDDKGLLASRLAGGPPSRRGRPRRLFRATSRGLAAVKHTVASLARMQRGLEAVLDIQT